mmetsp:Transcript_57771/g.150550  ORF Transcript_57771/g.150550 Transcript_57771/m.150550 type:complete len:435 (-) Transcript_57771:155-1459(-)
MEDIRNLQEGGQPDGRAAGACTGAGSISGPGVEGAPPTSAPLVTTVNGQDEALVGRLRRWHRKSEWGFIFSELHSCDVFLDGPNAERAAELTEGDFVLFHLANDEGGMPYARSARRADLDEVERQQELLSPVYSRHLARSSVVPDLPRSSEAGYDGHATSSAAGAPREPPAVPVSGAPAGQAGTGVSAAPQLEAPRRSPPPPPPPPSHPAPGGPGFATQALGQAGLLQHQQPYVSPHQAYGGYPNYPTADRGFGMYQQGAWPNSDAVLSTGGLGTQSSLAQQQQQQQPQQQPLPSAQLLLEPPPALARRDPKAIVMMLKGAPIARRPQTFRSSRNGVATQIGQEWVQMLRQACSAVQEHGDDAEGSHVQSNTNWGDVSQWGMWGAASASTQIDGNSHGDGYGGSGSMVNQMMNPVMLGMHGGSPSFYSATPAPG